LKKKTPQRRHDDQKYEGYNLREAVTAAMENGAYEGWQWLIAWWQAGLEKGERCPPPFHDVTDR